MEYTPVGHAANLASRLQTVHQLVSETRKVAEGYFEFHALGQIQVKGVRQPIDIFEVTGPGPSRTHFQLSVRQRIHQVRRPASMSLRRSCELATRGHGQMCAIVAEAGAGKALLEDLSC